MLARPGESPGPVNASVDEEQGISVLQVWFAVRKNWILIATVVLAALLASAFYTLGQTRIFRANATIQIDPTAARPLGNQVQAVVDTGTGAYWTNKEYYETQFKIIQSRRIAEETVRSLGLHRDGAFVENLPKGQAPIIEGVSIEVAANILRSRLGVEPVKDSRLVNVSLEDADPERARRVLSALVKTYVEQNVDDIQASTETASDWLRQQLDKLKHELESKEIALHDYKKDKNILSVSIDDQSNMLRGEMQQLSEALTRVRARFEEISARNNQLSKIDLDDPTNLPAGELLSSSILQELRQDYINAKREHAGLLAAGKGTNHPETMAAAARIETTRQALSSEVKNIKGAVQRELRAAGEEAGGLNRLLESAKTRALDLNLLEIEYNRLRREKVNTEKLYSLVLERTKESDLTRAGRFNNLRIIDEPRTPTAPVRPRLPISLLIGGFGGLALGLGLALGRELLDRTVKLPEHVERDVGLTFLGLIPSNGANAGRAPPYYARRRRRQPSGERAPPELIVHAEPSSGIAEAARAIRTNILFMAPDEPYRRLLVTSAGPGEGKTTVACCIAIAMAQAGQRVLLLDCDLRRPRLHRIFARANDIGVSTALLDPSVLDDARLGTEIPNLSLLPAGPHVPNPAELLQSDSFTRLLDALGARYDRLIIDSPPVGPVTDAAVLSRRVDATVVVIRAFRTTRDLARRAKRSLADVGARMVGAVLNAVDLDRRDYGSQYYYYHRDGYAAGDQVKVHDSKAKADESRLAS